MAAVKKTSVKKPNMDLDSKVNELKDFLQQCKRVLMVSRKPTREEFLTISKVTGLGICVLGALGFIIHVPITYIKGLIKP
ncbi:MAG: protein transport protein subunit gamma [Methanothermococcus sp.]|uniref:protein translocase SEC61 complex subunit gamma n=1 Tax=Methanothermococcus TaxID=155862 RepID=UPI0003736E2A|nr:MULTISPECIES: protein translocase SEC61 complex subunit gamma [Methanothermococcus]MDK2789752.1 protein transport protein subunit gamma [Methanothermococcus sp.]MDK2986967.1 protein transport protein subunit gamma [Methanothermococcus sp.]